MKLIDTHAHIDSSDFNKDFEQVIERSKEKLEFFINIGCDFNSSKRSYELANKYDFVYATVGVHPHDADTYNTLIDEQIRTLAEDPRVVAIGEIGLDYYKDYSPRDIQKDTFTRQLKLADKLNKPVVIHCRDAYEDTINILNENKSARGIMHSYSGSYEVAEMFLDRFYFSFSGPVTFKNAKKLRGIVSKMPVERILVETDCPYLTPEPFRGKRNEPAYVEFVAKQIAEIKGIDYSEFVDILYKNTIKAFELEK